MYCSCVYCRRARLPGQDGQATAEYALLTGAVAVILALVTAWATSTGKVSALLDAVFDNLIGSV